MVSSGFLVVVCDACSAGDPEETPEAAVRRVDPTATLLVLGIPTHSTL